MTISLSDNQQIMFDRSDVLTMMDLKIFSRTLVASKTEKVYLQHRARCKASSMLSSDSNTHLRREVEKAAHLARMEYDQRVKRVGRAASSQLLI